MLRRAASCAIGTLLLGLAAGRARAGDDPTRRGFDPDTSRPALSLDGGLAVETAGTARAGTREGALLFDYAEGLLSLRLGGQAQELLRSRLSAHLIAGYAFEHAEVAVHLPVILNQRADFSLLRDRGVNGPLVSGVAAAALGDLRLFGKLALLSQERGAPIGLAALLDLRLPTGNGKAFTSDGLSAIPTAVVTRSFGWLRLDAQLGYWLRGQGQYAQLVAHDGLTGGLGASASLPGFGPWERIRLMAEILGGWPRGYRPDSERYRAPLSTRGGVRAYLPACWAVEAGAGAGIDGPGYGREAWRVFGGVRYSCARREPVEEPLAPEPAREPAPPPPPEPMPPPPPEPPQTTVESPAGGEEGAPAPSREDLCPDQPDGCPEREVAPEPEPQIEVETQHLSLNDSIHFDTDKATIKPESDPILDSIATLLRDHPELHRIRVEGHTDNRGTAPYNRDLSLRRARSVVRALVERGIASERLVWEGYGFDRPVADNRTVTGRARNRRVEFTILDEGP